MRKDIAVKTLMKPTREIRPLSVVWEDGREYEIDHIYSVRPAPAKSGGGMGLRYEVRIAGKIKYLYLDEYVWFIEV